jgi:hypothetical protein
VTVEEFIFIGSPGEASMNKWKDVIEFWLTSGDPGSHICLQKILLLSLCANYKESVKERYVVYCDF